jgi:hypothetical protein
MATNPPVPAVDPVTGVMPTVMEKRIGTLTGVAGVDASTGTPRYANGLRMKNSDGSAYVIDDSLKGSGAGMINLAFKNTTGYGYAHLTTTTGFQGTALIGVGLDAPGTGFVFSNKVNGGLAIYLDHQETITDAVTSSLLISQKSATAPATIFAQDLANTAPVLRLASRATGSQHKAIADHVASDGTTKWFERRSNDGKAFQYAQAHFGGAATTAVTRTIGAEFAYNATAGDTALRFYRQAATGAGAETFYGHRIYTSTNELRIGSSTTSGAGVLPDGTETVNDLIRMRADTSVKRLAFYGAAPVPQPTVPVAATDAATTMVLVNALRTALVSEGLVI